MFAIVQAIYILLILLVLLKLGLKIHEFCKYWKLFNDAPGPRDFNLLYGNLHLLLRQQDPFEEYALKCKKYFRVWFGPFKPVLILHHPDTVKLLLKTAEPKNRDMGSIYSLIIDWFGEGLLIANGKKWARSRRLLTPAFHFDMVKAYVNVFNHCTGTMLNQISKYADSGSSFDLFPVISNCTLDIILRCAFSFETECQKEGKIHPYVESVHELSTIATQRNRNLLLFPAVIFKLTKNGRRFYKHIDFVHSVAEDIIEKRKTELEKGDISTRKNLDFLDILLKARDSDGEGLSDLEIQNEVDTFLFAGYGTTASAATWILFSLAQNPVYQEKAQKEIDSILEGRDIDDIEWDDFKKMEYLTMCIKEGLRRWAPVPALERVTTQEVTIDNVTYPPGTFFGISLHYLHNNPDIWKDPKKFDPERFRKDNICNMEPFTYCPFSAGPRNCIGQVFAMNEEKVLIAKFLYRYSLSLDPTHEVIKTTAGVTVPANGIKVFIKKRKWKGKMQNLRYRQYNKH